MSRVEAIVNLFRNPRKIVRVLGSNGILNWLPDNQYLKIIYRCEMGKVLNLKKPQTFNEKLQWLKINNRKIEYSTYVDKFEVRKYVNKKIGNGYLIPLIGVYDSVEEINWDELPNKFVIKCTHGSGSNIICKNKNKLDLNKTKIQINKWMNKNWFWLGREWPYKNVKPRIIIEEYLEQIDGDELRDYRFFCFDGEVKFIAVDLNINDKSKTRRNLYDLDWNLLPARISYPQELHNPLPKPERLDEMIDFSNKLAENIPHVRVDFYNIKNQIIFGEMTFFHQTGLGKIQPDDFDKLLGSWIQLPGNID